MWTGYEEDLNLTLIDWLCHSTLGSRVTKKERRRWRFYGAVQGAGFTDLEEEARDRGLEEGGHALRRGVRAVRSAWCTVQG